MQQQRQHRDHFSSTEAAENRPHPLVNVSQTPTAPEQTSRPNRIFAAVFWCLIGCLPLAMYRSWGNSFSEPKAAILILVCLLLTLHKAPENLAPQRKSKIEKLWLAGLLIVFTAQILGSIGVPNRGFAYLRLVMSAALIIIPLSIARSELSLNTFCRVLLLPVSVVIVGALAMSLFRIALFSDYTPFGSTIGLKNSLSVFLAQLLPFFGILFLQSSSRGKLDTFLRYTCILFSALCLWVLFMSRTRSAWWMLIIYGFVILYSLRRSPAEARRIARPAGISVLLGALLFAFVPDKLQWTSATPYLDSFTSLMSFERSSGRVELWQVALAIISTTPVPGLGTGQYPILWRDYLSLTAIDPLSFGFLRSDLPLFNDYLQMVVENGIPVGVVFALVLGGLPLYVLFRPPQKRRLSATEISLLLVCIAVAANAFFDYPFQRAETVLLYSMALGFFFRLNRQGSNAAPDVSSSTRRFIRFLPHALLGSFLLYTFILLTTGLTARSVWHKWRDNDSLRIAHAYWPWDMQWAHPHMLTALRKGDPELGREIVESRSQAWPGNAESSLMWARYYEHMQEYAAAVKHYRNAVTHVPGGPCYHVAYQYYLKMISRNGFPKDVVLLTDNEVDTCR